nr:MAG TPA: transmembrane protein [Caudoviricetes sp.]
MNNKTASSGIGICSVLQIVFVVLKLTKLIDWSWWLVLVPLWTDIGFGLLYLLIALIIWKS